MLAAARTAGRWAARVAAGLSLLLLLVLGVGPLTGRYRVVTVLSGSMSPTLPRGSVVFSTPEPLPQVAAGQVITFQDPTAGRVQTHRVVEVVAGGPEPLVRTRGDANDAPDPWLARLEGGPVWQARFAVSRLGSVLAPLRRPGLHRLTTLVAPALFLAACLGAIWRRPDAGTA